MTDNTYDSNPENHSHSAKWINDDAKRICYECQRKTGTYLQISSRQIPISYVTRVVCCRCAYFCMNDEGIKYPFPCVTAELVNAPHLWRGALDQMNKIAQEHIDTLNRLDPAV